MERYCGFLKGDLMSRSQPWRNLDERLLHLTRLHQLRMMYELDEELPSKRSADKYGLTSRERVHEECKIVLLIPTRGLLRCICRSPNNFAAPNISLQT